MTLTELRARYDAVRILAGAILSKSQLSGDAFDDVMYELLSLKRNAVAYPAFKAEVRQFYDTFSGLTHDIVRLREFAGLTVAVGGAGALRDAETILDAAERRERWWESFSDLARMLDAMKILKTELEKVDDVLNETDGAMAELKAVAKLLKDAIDKANKALEPEA